MSEVERALRQLAPELAFPPQPDLAVAVGERLRASRAAPRRRSRLLALVLAAVVLALTVALAVPPARSALLRLLEIGGVRIERVEEQPFAAYGDLDLGELVTLAEARRAVDFPILVPPAKSEWELERVYLDRGVPGGMVTFAWPCCPRLLLSELSGDELLLKKLAVDETAVDRVEVAGAPGVWISGRPHVVTPVGGRPRLAGNVLIWVRGGVTFRLEGELSRERMLALARSLTRAWGPRRPAGT